MPPQPSLSPMEFDETGPSAPSVIAPEPPQPPEPVGFQPSQISPRDAEGILRQLGLSSIPTQEARLGAAITDLLPIVQGSPAAIRETVAPQIATIRNNLSQVFDAVSQRLGRFGGGQVTRERGRALGATGEQLQQLFAQQPAIAFQQLLQTLSGFSPLLLAQPPLQTTTSTIPPDFGDLGEGLLNLLATGQQVFAPSQASLATPFTPATLPLSQQPEPIPTFTFGAGGP